VDGQNVPQLTKRQCFWLHTSPLLDLTKLNDFYDPGLLFSWAPHSTCHDKQLFMRQ